MGRGWAVITGASSGLGAVFAARLAQRGHPVLLAARRADRMEELAARIRAAGGEAKVLAVDLGTAEGVETLADAALELPAVDLLVNNAGFGVSGHVEELPRERELQCIQLNVVSVVDLTRRLLPALVRSKGGVITLGSLIAFQPVPYFTTYAATKAFVLHWSEGMAFELAPKGVTVTCVCPGPVTTEFVEHSQNKRFQEALPQSTPEEVVDVALAAHDARRVVKVVGWVPRLLSWFNTTAPRAFVRWNMAGFAAPDSKPTA